MSISKSDLVLHAEGNYLVGTQKYSQVVDAIGGLFGAIEELSKHGILVSVNLGAETVEPDEFPKMMYKDGENPVIVGSDDEADDLGEGWSDKPGEGHPVMREPQFPHQQATPVPTDPSQVPQARNPIGEASKELPEDSPIISDVKSEGPTGDGPGGTPDEMASEGPVAEPESETEPEKPLDDAPEAGTPSDPTLLPPNQQEHPAAPFGPAVTTAQQPVDAPAPKSAPTNDEQPSGAPNVEVGSGGAPGSGAI